MAQARVTDFFSQRKKGGGDATTRRKGRQLATRASGVRATDGAAGGAARPRTRSARPAPCGEGDGGSSGRPAPLSSNPVHDEFLRVIDEAAGVEREESSVCPAPNAKGDDPASPRTPKRTSADAEFDLGAAVFSATAGHSTAKRRRDGGAAVEKDPAAKGVKSRARKKLVLPTDTVQKTTAHCPEGPKPPTLSPTRTKDPKDLSHAGQHDNALSKEDLVALKSRLERIKKQAKNLSGPSSSAVSTSSDSSAVVPPTAPPPAIDIASLKARVARAKELSAKPTRKAEAQEQQSNQPEAQSQDCDAQPAYQRYHALAQAGTPGLTLPYKYKLLAEMFRSADTITSILYNRTETVTFTKVKQGVQDMLHKRFEESHLGQIRTVFADAYKFRQERNIPTFNYNIKKGSYQLTMEPVIEADQKEARPLLTATRLLERRRVFHQNLLSIVKLHHKAFLSSLLPPLSVPEDQLSRWHPRFNVDMVPVVQACPLPQPPNVERLTTASEVLDKARSYMTLKMEKALTAACSKAAGAQAADPQHVAPQIPAAIPLAVNPPPAPAAPAQSAGALKGVSQELLDRIRAKEAQKLMAAMTRNPVQEGRLLIMSRLPELARILRNVFVAERKPALVMELACNRMVASYRSALTPVEMEKHLQLLAELVPDWLTIHPVRKDLYLKLSKNMELNIVLDKLAARLKEEERL